MPAAGVTGDTGSVVKWNDPLTFIHELCHLYGKVGHTDHTLQYDGYLMHPGETDALPAATHGDVGGIVEEEDTARFYAGQKI